MTTQAERIIGLLSKREPVCPEGVEPFQNGGYTWVRPSEHFSGGIGVMDDGTMRESGLVEGNVGLTITPECLRYAADLSDYRARKHAEGDRQRKLDAVRAAEEAYEAQKRAGEALRAESWAAEMKTARALDTARREAGL